MRDMRIMVATGLMATVLSVLGGAQAAAGPATVKALYACDGQQNLVVARSAMTAFVQLGGRGYELQRKSSSIGHKYISSTAALIIDGRSATFVADDNLQIGACRETT